MSDLTDAILTGTNLSYVIGNGHEIITITLENKIINFCIPNKEIWINSKNFSCDYIFDLIRKKKL